MRIFILVFGFLLVACVAYAADIDGTWTGEAEIMGQTIPMSYTFKAEGKDLTGFTSGMNGEKVEAKDGKIDGNNISFSMVFNFGEDMKIDYKGVLSGDELKLKWDAMGQVTEIVLKRSK